MGESGSGGRFRDLGLLALASVAGVLFFASLGRMWPLVPVDLAVPTSELIDGARLCLRARGFDTAGYSAAVSLRVDPVVDWIDEQFGRSAVDRHVAAGAPLVVYTIDFKRAGEPVEYTVDLLPSGRPVAFIQSLEDDTPGARVDAEVAREIAERAVEAELGIALAEYTAKDASLIERTARRDHVFSYERVHSAEPKLREVLRVGVAGDVANGARRQLERPPAAIRAERAAAAPSIALETVGFAALGVTAIAAFVIFLRALGQGRVRLGRMFVWPAVVCVGFTITHALESGASFRYWDPLWPRWIAAFRFLFERSGSTLWVLFVLLAVIAAGDALDQRASRSRSASLWLLARGRVWEPAVGLASARGFMVGLLCGGAMAVSVIALQQLGARTELQPRGFFFYTLNSAVPALTSLCFFLGVALTEELGYRFFGGLWFHAWSKRRWIAILGPGLIYGLTHTRLDFLPPADPWWGRAVVLTVVGCVWGWAFFRYDALTVVLSHFTADLFIFNWPLLASDRPAVVATAAATVALPLVPAAVAGVAGLGMRRARSS